MKHKIKSIFRNLKKIPFFFLLCVTLLLADGVDDGILPWPSPFHIQPGKPDGFITMADAGNPAHRDAEDGKDRTNGNDMHANGSNPDANGNGGSAADGSDSGPNGNGGSAADGSGSGPNGNGGSAADDSGSDPNGNGGSAEDGSDSGPNGNGGSAADGSGANGNGGVHANGTEDGSLTGGAGANGNEGFGTDGSDNDASLDGSPHANDAGNAGSPVPTQPALGEDGLPLVQYTAVEEDYFDDAVFIGDSRTRSLQLYADWEHTTFLADTGLTIYTVLDKKLTPSTMNTKTTVTDYLANHQFKKIYLMLGINELGTGTAESFCKSYSEVLDQIRTLQPDAIIYLQAILHISESKDREHTYINNAAIIERNEALRSLTDNEYIFWLDSNPAVCDENGYLIDDYTFDGVHLQAKYVYLWTDYLKEHAIRFEDASFFQTPFPSPEPRAIQ